MGLRFLTGFTKEANNSINEDLRGVRVIAEVDSPSHVGAGWEWGEEAGLGSLLACKEEKNSPTCFGPPCGYLDPTNPNVYSVLQDIFAQLLASFSTSRLFHLGGFFTFLISHHPMNLAK